MVMHRMKFAPKLGRTRSHRMAMLRNMVTSLIQHERILTTHTKAKYAQRYAEKMVAYARANTWTAHAKATAFVRGVDAQRKLFTLLAQRYAYRPSGFTRVIHVKRRDGDNAPLSYLEFVDRPGELRPAMLQTPQTWAQVLANRKVNDARQRKDAF